MKGPRKIYVLQGSAPDVEGAYTSLLMAVRARERFLKREHVLLDIIGFPLNRASRGVILRIERGD